MVGNSIRHKWFNLYICFMFADGKIDFNEFLGIMEYVQKVSGIPGAQEYKLKEAFDYFDKDGRYVL